MPKCPKCGEEIDHLIYYAYELQKAYVGLDAYGNLEYGNWDSLGVTKGEPDYECPKCKEVLFHDEEEARRFLQNKKDRKIRLTEKEAYRISQTPPNECWICAYLTERICKDEQGYFIYESDLKDEGIREHLRQILGRDF